MMSPRSKEQVLRQKFEVGQTISNVVFRPGENGTYINSERGTKIIILDKGSMNMITAGLLRSGTSINVEVLRDTKPDNARTGAYIVKLIDLAKAPWEADAGKGVAPESAVLIDDERGILHVLDTVVPLRTDADPIRVAHARSRFENYTLDQRTVAAIGTVAEAFASGQPCLLEGETAVSKTSAIEFVAAQTGNEVARLNLNGQSDTSELVGKFVPNDSGAQFRLEELLHTIDSLSENSKNIVMRAKTDGRALSHLESQQIAANEGIKVSDWTWKNGLVAEAMLQGKILILDEGNLAEPQVLERLNSVLENPPSITLTENGGLVIRKLSPEEQVLYDRGELPGVAPIHENFRIFMTMNPAEYQGRSVLSPAFKNRWPLYHYVDRPSESDYRDMLIHQVFGEQPNFTHEGVVYGGNSTETGYERLQQSKEKFAELIPKLAKFHTKMEEMARTRQIGRSRREPYIFTRRDLLEFVRYLENKKYVSRQSTRSKEETYIENPARVTKEAIQRFYLNKIVDGDDRRKVQDLLDSIDL